MKTPFTPNHLERRINRYHPSAFLLAAQLILLVLYSVFDGIAGGRAILSAAGVLVLVLVIWVVMLSPSIRWIAWVLAIPAFILSLASLFDPSPTILALSALLEGILYFYTGGSLIAYMMSDKSVTADELFAAGATFTLLAWGYAYFYLVCSIWVPESFLVGAHPNAPFTFIELLSLSFTNLSATGLGDVLPISAPARTLSMLEQFTGIGYVAVVVSRLIGLTINIQPRNNTQ